MDESSTDNGEIAATSANQCSEPEESAARVRRDDVGDAVATARLLVISPLLDSALSRSARRKRMIEIAGQGWQHPELGHRQLSERTLRRWLARFEASGLDGLRPRFRPDRGARKTITDEAFEAAKALKEELPSRDVERVIELLEMRGIVAEGAIKRSTLHRHLAAEGLTGRRIKRPDDPTGRFCARCPGDVWQTDEKHGPYIVPGSERVKTKIFAFLDDCSRNCCGIEAFSDGTEVNLERCFKRSIRVWRPPRLVYTDRGKVFVANQLRRICAELGIGIVAGRPYRPQSRGKIERFWGTLDSFIAEANAAQFTSLKALNEALWAWVDVRYNRAPHSALADDMTPFGVYADILEELPAVSEEDLERAFRHLEHRKVAKDGTFSLYGTLYSAGTAFAGQRIELRINPEDPSDVLIYREYKRIKRASVFSPPDRLPPARPGTRKGKRPRRPSKSSRQLLDSVTRKHRDGIEKSIAAESDDDPDSSATRGDIFTFALLLERLDRPEEALSAADRHACQGFFDMYGPIDRQLAFDALDRAIARHGTRRHITVYLRAIIQALLTP